MAPKPQKHPKKGKGERPSRKARPQSIEDVLLEQEAAGQKAAGHPKSAGYTLTVQEISADKITKVAKGNWAASLVQAGKAPAFQPELVVSLYNDELAGQSDTPPALKRVMLLEVSQYLENYLWPHFDEATASFEHVMSIILMVNEKFRGGVPAWTCFHTRPGAFTGFFQAFLRLKQQREQGHGDVAGVPLRLHERNSYLAFTVNIFQSLEDEMVRGQVLRLVSLPLWHALSAGRLQLELHALPVLAKHWKSLLKKEQKASKQPGYQPPLQRPEVAFLPSLLDEFLEQLDAVLVAPEQQADGSEHQGGMPTLAPGALSYCERFVTLLIDLLSQLPTRRFVRTLLDDRAILVKTKLAGLYRHPGASLYRQLVDLMQFYIGFPINDHTGDPLTDDEVTASQYEKVCQLQRLFFKHWPALKELALSNCGTVERRDTLRRALQGLSAEELRLLVVGQLRLVAADDPWAEDPAFLMEVMLSTYERRKSQREVINEMPLYPTEGILWDETQIPSVTYTGEGCLALPKLNLQFLTPHDYLLRNFHLFRLEATYEIREDIADVLGRVGAYWDDTADPAVVKFAGWARMALPLSSFRITEVRKPAVGDLKPAAVTADVIIDTRGLRGDVRSEWDDLKQHDVLFLLTVRPPSAAELGEMSQGGQQALSVADKHGLVYVRGCEVIELKDEGGKLMNDFTGRVKRDEWKPPEGTLRTLTVALDTAQYQLDVGHLAKHKDAEDVYATFNLLVRRKPKENNFKAVLESIRDLMNETVIIPPWLHDIFLGYGDPGAAQWRQLPKEQQLQRVDFKDTFLDAQHVRDSFPHHDVRFEAAPGQPEPLPPYKITFPEDEEAADGKQHASNGAAAVVEEGGGTKQLVVQSYTPPDPGPYPQNQPPTNRVRFTQVQVDAIISGVQPGLTMVVGPPGTGKTDTAVQIMHVLYHNFPGQRTLLIAHSNQALNDLFTKILERDVPARYLLRLGMGEQELETADDFSRVGRVNAMLARRLELLAQVERMARQFGVTEDVAYTCETAGYFWLLHVLSRWEKFVATVEKQRSSEAVRTLFPFTEYFADAPQPLFKGQSYEQDMERARGCFRHLRALFQELEECRAFELLKGQADRVNYLMTKQAKIVAMTCTHAALKRREFLELAFQYDNLLMEEAGQILEIETFIPMLLQRQEEGEAVRLKRVVLIGDHHQLPPVVQNMAIQKYARLDQPLFTRFIRLGTPYLQLNAQGRARPSIARLYSWRYKQLGDLPAVQTGSEYLTANPGFAFDYQFIDVPDFMGKGEIESSPYYYQNLGEAEYMVGVYCFMRLLGYPAHKITLLTTYNGQKDLIKDVVRRRCANHPLLGWPAKIATVDKYQGQQNDYVLLSLVRTRVVGHLRDVRRLVVAMSRARLGLYVFGRKALFGNCYELQPTFKQLLSRPTQLALVKGESYATCTRQAADKVGHDLLPNVEAMLDLVGRITVEQEAAAAAPVDEDQPAAGQDGAAVAAAVPPPRPPPAVPPPRPPPGVPPPRPPPGEPNTAAASGEVQPMTVDEQPTEGGQAAQQQQGGEGGGEQQQEAGGAGAAQDGAAAEVTMPGGEGTGGVEPMAVDESTAQ